jgi:2-oxoglutarate ferredoxin oxidoreductase subunit beta
MLKLEQVKTDVHNDWCPGCGDFGILSALQQTIVDLGRPLEKIAVFSGIGCSGKMPHFLNVYGIHTLHGRSLPIAMGAKVANRDLTVIAVGGDGDGYGIGCGHFIATGRRNLDLTYVVHNNGVYGLTKGQSSPTLERGLRTKSMPSPAIVEAVNPITLAICAGYTFVARSYSNNVRHLKQTLRAAIEHPGTSLVDVLQPCPTYNDLHTKEYWSGADRPDKQPRTYDLQEAGFDAVVRDPQDEAEILRKKAAGAAKALEPGDREPIGIFFQWKTSTFGERLAERMPALREKPLVDLDVSERDLTPLFAELS